jgi:hypothetical protein
MPPANLARVLRQYGQALESVRYSVAGEETLPCDKDLLRECLVVAMALCENEAMRERLREGYVMIEAFVPRREYEAVLAFEDIARTLRHPASDISQGELAALIEKASTANQRASAVEARVTDRMLTRRREVAGVC